MGYMKKLAMELDEYEYLRNDEWSRIEREYADTLIMEQLFKEENESKLHKPSRESLERAAGLHNLASYGNNRRTKFAGSKLPRFIQTKRITAGRNNKARNSLRGSIYNRVTNRGNRPKKAHTISKDRGYIPIVTAEGLPF